MDLISYALVVAGLALLILSLLPLRRLVNQLPPGPLRFRWFILTALILLFIAGYFGYAKANWDRHFAANDLIVPAVFFLGSLFVLLANFLSLQTAVVMRRLAVLEHENITDPLTGIYNRRYLDRRLPDEVARAQRYGAPLSVLLADIDHFKRVNDIHGHQVGDVVLSNLGKLVVNTVRNTDIVVRYGGEEILIITPNTSAATATRLAERLRQKVEESVLAPDADKLLHVTVSIGVAFYGRDIGDASTLIKSVDAALYRAKHEGRNCVAVNR
ncbi:MAG: GGDEF domain-containing protein [Sulfuricaulis sp.]